MRTSGRAASLRAQFSPAKPPPTITMCFIRDWILLVGIDSNPELMSPWERATIHADSSKAIVRCDSRMRSDLLLDHAAFQGLINGFAAQQHGHHHRDERGAQQGDGEIAATCHLYRQNDASKRRSHTCRK